MYESETYDVILQRMLDRVSDKLDKRESSLIWDTHSSTAIELQMLYIELETLIANSYGDTAAREFLVLLCKDRGISPDEATNAVLEGKFTPETIDVTGQRFNIGNVNYTVMEMVTPGMYRVVCETAGVAGNQYLGQMIPVEYIDGLQTATLTKVLIPGEDEEDTEVLRERYLASFNEQKFGGNRADYLAKVKGIDGIGDVKVLRNWNSDINPADMIPTDAVTAWYSSVVGVLDEEVAVWLSTVYVAALEKKLTVGGTVLVTIVDADDYGEASKVLIDSVQELLDPEQNAGAGYGLAPIGHVVNVKSAVPVSINVTTELAFDNGYDWTNLENKILDAVDAYFLELRKKWADSSSTIIRTSQIESRILSVKGIADISNTKMNDSPENLTLEWNEIPVLGGVSA